MTKTKLLKGPTRAIFLKMIWFKDIKYDNLDLHSWHLAQVAPVTLVALVALMVLVDLVFNTSGCQLLSTFVNFYPFAPCKRWRFTCLGSDMPGCSWSSLFSSEIWCVALCNGPTHTHTHSAPMWKLHHFGEPRDQKGHGFDDSVCT